jgi:hypothetical protein
MACSVVASLAPIATARSGLGCCKNSRRAAESKSGRDARSGERSIARGLRHMELHHWHAARAFAADSGGHVAEFVDQRFHASRPARRDGCSSAALECSHASIATVGRFDSSGAVERRHQAVRARSAADQP